MLAEKSLLEKLGLKKQEDPRELVRKCQRMIRTEIRGVERQMLGERRPPAPPPPTACRRRCPLTRRRRRCACLPVQTCSASRRRRRS